MFIILIAMTPVNTNGEFPLRKKRDVVVEGPSRPALAIPARTPPFAAFQSFNPKSALISNGMCRAFQTHPSINHDSIGNLIVHIAFQSSPRPSPDNKMQNKTYSRILFIDARITDRHFFAHPNITQQTINNITSHIILRAFAQRSGARCHGVFVIASI